MLIFAAASSHPYGWLCLAPPLVAIVVAVATRRVIESLLAGIFLGALLTTRWDVGAAIGATLETHLWKTLVDENRLRVFAFTLLMGAMVGVIYRSGGMRGLVIVAEKWANSRRRGQLVTWMLGMLIFFDDYANTVLLGNTLRPLTDKLRISREKLAYLVDSTAAPVAGLALVSTWVAGEITFVQDGLDQLAGNIEANAFQLFVDSIPYRFYILWCLALVPLIGWLDRDFGPMLLAERRAVKGAGYRDTKSGLDYPQPSPETPAEPSARWINAAAPVVVTVAMVVWLLYRTGRTALAAAPAARPSWRDVFGAADAYYALLWASLAGFVTAVVMTRAQRLLSASAVQRAAFEGAAQMLPALAVLWLASTLSSMTGNKTTTGTQAPTYSLDYRLYTGEYLTGLLSEQTADPTSLAPLVPSLVFILSAIVSFATGTSWGTMAIVMPMAVPLAFGVVGGSAPAQHPLVLCSIGSVLAGSIFGDHCSPISDTTVLSSQSSGCEHVAHVWTQLPYALLVAAVSVVFGTLPVGFGAPVWATLPAGVLVLALVLLWVGQRP